MTLSPDVKEGVGVMLRSSSSMIHLPSFSLYSRVSKSSYVIAIIRASVSMRFKYLICGIHWCICSPVLSTVELLAHVFSQALTFTLVSLSAWILYARHLRLKKFTTTNKAIFQGGLYITTKHEFKFYVT